MRDIHDKSRAYGTGIYWKITTQWALKSQIYQYHQQKAHAHALQFALGADYRYNKWLSFYIDGAVMDNHHSQLSPFEAGRSAKPEVLVPDVTPYAMSVGMLFGIN